MTDDILHASKGRPKCVSLVICDQVIEDKQTNTKSLIGIFSTVFANKLPAVHAKMGICVSLLEGNGTWPIQIRLVAPSGAEVIKAEGSETFANERQVRDVVMILLGVTLAEPGDYAVDVLVGGTPVASRYFSVQLFQGPQP
jgi:hypothetical protein